MSWLRIRTVIRRHIYVLWRAPHRWFDIAFWPLMDVILWGSLGTYIARQDPSSASSAPYLIGGILMFHVLFQSQIAVGTGFMEETWSRNLLNMLTTPIRELEYLLGIVIYGLGKLVVAIAAVNLCAYLFYDFWLGELGWGVLLAALCLLIAGWALGLIMIGLILRFGQSAEILTWATPFLILALSGVFNPIRAIPGPLQPLAHALPTTYAFEAGRTLLAGDGMPWGDLARAGFGGLALLALAAWFCARMLRTFRQRGFVTRYS
jgi:ABC-2 type transport system permease protein